MAVKQRISQSGFALLQKSLLEADLLGYGPDTCAAYALQTVGLSPQYGVELTLVVDPQLDGPVYPFTEWPAEAALLRSSGGA